MKWFRIPKESSVQPKVGNYRDWKEDLSIEGKEQCVYCSININSFGGIRNFHVEHYRPKGKDKFPKLENKYSNLFFACPICNCFKSDDWPNEPSENLDNYSFPDPSVVDYSSFLIVDDKFELKSNFISGEYIIHKLFLNRPQLILERKSFYMHAKLKKKAEKLKEIALELKKQNKLDPLTDSLLIAMIDITILLIEGKYINPYLDKQTKR